MTRHELSDQEWQVIAPLLPAPALRGRPPTDSRVILNGIVWILRTGAPWRDLPADFGSWQTVYHRFARWRRDGRRGGEPGVGLAPQEPDEEVHGAAVGLETVAATRKSAKELGVAAGRPVFRGAGMSEDRLRQRTTPREDIRARAA